MSESINDKVDQILKQEQTDIITSFRDRAADVVSEFGGSWSFIIVFSLFCGAWIIFNLVIFGFDNYPFILLNLILSCLAVFQAPFILMSQNRLADIDRKRAENDYRIDLQAALEITDINDKMNQILVILQKKS